MGVIRQDDIGLYIKHGPDGRVRPMSNTSFSIGDNPKSHHFGGSVYVGVGKLAGAKSGEYQERWMIG